MTVRIIFYNPKKDMIEELKMPYVKNIDYKDKSIIITYKEFREERFTHKGVKLKAPYQAEVEKELIVLTKHIASLETIQCYHNPQFTTSLNMENYNVRLSKTNENSLGNQRGEQQGNQQNIG